MPLGTLSLGLMAIAMLGCGGGSHTLDDDAGEPEGIDAATPDAHEPMPDVPVESLDTAADAPPLVRHASCAYHFGAQCRVECTDAPEVPIELFIEWSSPYCCEDLHFGYDDTHFTNCRCVGGLIQCLSPGLGDGREYAIPQTWCDLCGIEPSGPPDAYTFDAGP